MGRTIFAAEAPQLEVYLVVLEDRHIDTVYRVYNDRAQAEQVMREMFDEYQSHYAESERDIWEEVSRSGPFSSGSTCLQYASMGAVGDCVELHRLSVQ